MLDKRQIWVFFLFEFKMGHKTIETTWNINTEFGSRTANEHTVQWFFKKFCKGDKGLEDKEHSGRHRKWTMDNWKRWSSYDYRSCWKLHVNHFMVIWYFKQIGKVKKFDKWISHELTESQKNLSFWTVFSYSLQQQQTISQLDCDVWWKVGCIPNWWRPAQWLGQEKLQSTSPNQTCAKNSHGHCLVVFLPVWSFWILAEPLHLRSRLSKLMRCTKNCKACSQHWSTEWAQFFSMTTSYHTLHQQLFKSWTNWTMKFCPTCHIHLTSQQPTSASSSISTSFCRQNTSTTSRRQKMLAKRWWILKKGFLCCRSKQTYISLAKMCQLKWFLFC